MMNEVKEHEQKDFLIPSPNVGVSNDDNIKRHFKNVVEAEFAHPGNGKINIPDFRHGDKNELLHLKLDLENIAEFHMLNNMLKTCRKLSEMSIENVDLWRMPFVEYLNNELRAIERTIYFLKFIIETTEDNFMKIIQDPEFIDEIQEAFNVIPECLQTAMAKLNSALEIVKNKEKSQRPWVQSFKDTDKKLEYYIMLQSWQKANSKLFLEALTNTEILIIETEFLMSLSTMSTCDLTKQKQMLSDLRKLSSIYDDINDQRREILKIRKQMDFDKCQDIVDFIKPIHSKEAILNFLLDFGNSLFIEIKEVYKLYYKKNLIFL